MIKCSSCRKRPVYSKGLCTNCYMNDYYKNNEKYRKYRDAYTREYQGNNPEKTKQYRKNHYERNKEKCYLIVKKRRQENPNMARAHSVTQNHLKLYRPEHCEICNKECKPEGHHPDYDKPYLVIWCCLSCHAIFRTKPKEGEQIAIF